MCTCVMFVPSLRFFALDLSARLDRVAVRTFILLLYCLICGLNVAKKERSWQNFEYYVSQMDQVDQMRRYIGLRRMN
jgi:hypothetical protein